jgi:hypothetical protein
MNIPVTQCRGTGPWRQVSTAETPVWRQRHADIDFIILAKLHLYPDLAGDNGVHATK